MKNIFLCILLLLSYPGISQYNTVGDASQISSTCFELTPEEFQRGGAVWNENLFDINSYFRIEFTLDMGTIDGMDADGVAFVFQSQGTNAIGSPGGALGYLSISPSIAVAFRTWTHDKIEIWEDGEFGDVSGAAYDLPAVSGPQPVTIIWDPVLKTLTVDYQNNGVDLTYVSDIKNDIFSGDSEVYWGFTAATGGSSAKHTVCIDKISMTAPIPTLSQWGIIALGMLTMIFGVVFIRQRKTIFA